MKSWKYAHQTTLYFGDDWLEQLDSILDTWSPNLRPCIISGRSAARANGWIDKVASYIGSKDVLLFDKVEPEPSHNTVIAGARFLHSNAATSVIALGGGSVIDAAKMMASVVGTDADVSTLMNRKAMVPKRWLPLIALPTTAGSGSEMTPYSVLTNAETGEKQSLPSPEFYPEIAIVAPCFLRSVPRVVIGDTGMDALAHAFEALWSIHANPVSDALAFRAIQYCANHFLKYYRDSTDSAAAEGMALAASLAGKAFSNTFTAACHGLSYPIGRRFSLSHGASCAMTLHLIARVNQHAVRSKFADLAQVLGVTSAERIPDFIRNIRDEVDTIKSFRGLGATLEDLVAIAKGGYAPLLRNNPIALAEDDIVRLLLPEIR